MTTQIKSLFENDNFSKRRTSGHNWYDPESLITGAEVKAGLTYHDKRDWTHTKVDSIDPQAQYELACAGYIGVPAIPVVAPRVKAIDPVRQTQFAKVGIVAEEPILTPKKPRRVGILLACGHTENPSRYAYAPTQDIRQYLKLGTPVFCENCYDGSDMATYTHGDAQQPITAVYIDGEKVL